MFLMKPVPIIKKLFDKYYDKFHIVLEIFTDLLIVMTSAMIFLYRGIIPTVIVGVAAFGIHLFRLHRFIPRNNLLTHILILLAAVGISILLYRNNSLVWAIPINILSLYLTLSALAGRCIPNIKKNKDKLKISLLSDAALSFIVNVYLVTDTFVNNFSDFNFYYQQLYPTLLFDFVAVTSALTVILLSQSPKHFNIGICFIMGGTLATYIQYMFMNKRLDRLGMQAYNWKDQIGYSIFNGIVWLAILAVPFLMMKFNNGLWKKLKTIVPAVMLALHVITVGTMLATSKNDIFGRHNHSYMNSDEMYTVSGKKNVIVLVYDAVDNKYIKKVMDETPEKMQGLEDFTVYTNTCSVYDFTTMSFAQMFSGIDFNPDRTGEEFFDEAWKGEKAQKFYGGLHDMNYRVNAYNMSGGTASYWEGIYDNATVSDKPVKPVVETFYKKKFQKSVHSLELYRALPFALKSQVSDEDMNFENTVIFEYGYKNYENSDFLSDLELTKADNDSNYFIIQHTEGTHYPCDTYEELDTCLDITRSYIEQLKEFGVYDDSVIIVTSDHGEHSDGEEGATPIFMIKEANTTHESMETNNAPIYFTDLLSTLAVNAGFDKESAEKYFGNSIYDFDENSVRKRSWYERSVDSDYPKAKIYGQQAYRSSCNTFYEYAYEGDADDLDEMVKSGTPTAIHSINEFIP